MSDFLDSTSQFAAPTSTPTSTFDATAVDRRFKEIQAVEQRWELPPLPDAVRADLIQQDVPEGQISNLLNGLWRDYVQPEEPPANPLENLRFNLRDPDFGQSRFDQIRPVAAEVFGEEAPTELTVDAVKRFKLEAIERGFLEAPENGEVDSTWSPELNSVRYDMLSDDWEKDMSGHGWGSAPVSTVVEQIGKWTEPSGLIAAATELDLWWDFGAISDEFSDWGQKWSKVADSKNPLDFGKNLIDAVTGPIDDIALPAINLALLTTGIGSVANVARIGWAAKASRGGKILRGLYGFSDVGSAANLKNLGEASWTATKLMGSSRAPMQAIGQGLAAWRAAEPVKRAKSVAQLGMRLGFTSQVEDLLPGYQGGKDLSGTAIGAAGDAIRRAGQSPLALPAELLIAPYNIWTPGTFLRQGGEGLNVLNRTGSGIVRYAGTTMGRATAGAAVGVSVAALQGDDGEDVLAGVGLGALGGALLPKLGQAMSNPVGRTLTGGALGGAVGAGTAVLFDEDMTDSMMIGATTGATVVGAKTALARTMQTDARGLSKAIGTTGDFLAKLDYKPIADDQRVSAAFHRAMEASLTGPELERYQRVFQERNSFRAAFADHLGVDEESAAGAMAFVMMSAAIDHTAKFQAGLVRGGNWRERYHLARNKLIAQIRTFDLSNPTSTTVDDIVRAAVGDADSLEQYTKNFDRLRDGIDETRALEMAAAHNDLANKTIEQLLSVDKFPEMDNVAGAFGRLGPDESIGVLESYLPQVIDTFGNWPQFTAQTEAVQQWGNNGLLDNAVFRSVTNRFGNQTKPKAELSSYISKQAKKIDSEIVDTYFKDSNLKVAKAYRNGTLNPLARTQSAGSFTLMKVGTADKQQVAERAEQLRDLLDADRHLRTLSETGELAQLQKAAGRELSELSKKEFEALLKQVGITKRSKPAKYLNAFAARHDTTFAEMRTMIDTAMDDVANDIEFVTKFGLSEEFRAADNTFIVGGRERVEHRLKELQQKERYTAASIDVEDLVESVRATKGDQVADEFAAELEIMAEDGYKLVHGVEFLMPQDLTKNAMFADLGTRQMNAATLGNFFRARPPAERRLIEERRQRQAVVEAMAGRLGRDMHPDDDWVTNVLVDLKREILQPMQDQITERLADYQRLSWTQRRRLSWDSSFTPLRVEDLTARKGEVIGKLQDLGYTKEEAEAVYTALPKFRDTEFENLGLYGFEAKMRTRNELVQGLKYLSGTKWGDSLLARSAGGRRIGAVAGAVEGYTSSDGDFGETVKGAAIGGAVGSVAGAAASRRLEKLVPKAELMRAGQLGDQYARLRDSFRFTLSPFFDMSRYTEGMILSQTAAPSRLPDGSRLVLPTNMSPTAVRRRMGKRGFKAPSGENLKPADAWKQVQAEFSAAGRGDFDPEVLDPMGKWFKQVGIMGFSPTDWMVGAFAELRHAGLGADEAYRATREMYTYGMHGRSAAELSVNFVVFPFSFQKKALGHIAKWMNDDLARSVIIHDAFKTFETLDQQYNLKERWADHFPVFEQLNKLNMLAFGLSPGRWGGINRQLYEATYETTLAPFMPWGSQIKDPNERSEAEQLFRSMLPVYNDINWMMKNVKEQQQVIQYGQTTRNQVSSAYDEWNEYKTDLSRQLSEMGFTWSDMQRKPYLKDVKLAYELKRAELNQKYPAWMENKSETIGNRNAENEERRDALARAQAGQGSVDDVLLFQMEQHIAEVKRAVEFDGGDVSGGWEDAPVWAFEAIQSRGLAAIGQSPTFERLWDQFYRSDFGYLRAKLGFDVA